MQAITQRGSDKGNFNKVFYFSADTNAWHVFVRACSIATGRTSKDIEEELNNSGPGRLDAMLNEATKHITWDFRADPDEERFLGQLMAYAELEGQYPDVIVMDNLKNLDTGNSEDEFRALEENCIFLDSMAKQTGAAVIALHHVSGYFEDGFSQIPLSGIRGKVSKTPALILTLHRGLMNGSEQPLNVSVVKDRGNRADASGSYFVPVMTNLERMSFRG